MTNSSFGIFSDGATLFSLSFRLSAYSIVSRQSYTSCQKFLLIFSLCVRLSKEISLSHFRLRLHHTQNCHAISFFIKPTSSSSLSHTPLTHKLTLGMVIVYIMKKSYCSHTMLQSVSVVPAQASSHLSWTATWCPLHSETYSQVSSSSLLSSRSLLHQTQHFFVSNGR